MDTPAFAATSFKFTGRLDIDFNSLLILLL